MDPRPYHYQYRRPRLSNPTYQSVNLYQSLYHRGILNRYENEHYISTFKPKNQFHRQIHQNSIRKTENQIGKNSLNLIEKKHYFDRGLSNSVMLQLYENPQKDRPNSNKSNKSNDLNIKQQKPSILASYGKNSMVEQNNYGSKTNSNDKIYDQFNRFSVYKKQQKPYNIIGNYPRSTSTDLRKYPKFTLQDKLIQQGRYSPN